jgi:integrase
VKLLMLTGQRREEVSAAQWREIDLAAARWTLPAARVKNNREHQVPLSAPALAVLEAIPKIGDKFVLTTNGAVPFAAYGRGKRALDNLLPSDMKHWTLHDLRRTAASGMARLGIALPVIEKVLNHTSGSFAGIVAVYQRHDYGDEKRAALDRWAAFVSDLVNGTKHKKPNIVSLPARRQ